MARERSPNRDKAFEIYKEHDGDIANRKIAEILQISEKTVGGWKTKDKWVQKLNGVLQKNERSTPNKNMEYSKKRGAPKGNKNSVGNKGGSAPKRNQNAKTHGFFSKFLPKETLEIMDEMKERSAADLIYDQIQIQYAAIIRAQSIMFVIDKDDMAKEKSQVGWGDSGADRYDIQFAWDRQATFMNAQSRAMSEFRSLVKQFLDMASDDDERRLKLEQMRVNIDKTKADIARIKGEPEGEYEDDGFIDALDGKVEEVWNDGDNEET